jgi:glutathione S-transferase
MKLYQLPYSHYSAKVKIVLLEKGLSFETPELSSDYLHSPEFLALNPLGKVPFLLDGDFGIGESEVIVEYLEDRYPQPTLLPGTPQQRARSRWLSRFHDLYLGPQLSTLYFALSDGRAGKPEFAAEVDRLHELVALLESQIDPAPYFLGSQFTLADASFVLSYWYIGMLSTAHGRPVAESAMPRLANWFGAVKKRASVASVLKAAEIALGK